MNWNGLELPDKPYYQDDAVVIYNADYGEILRGIKSIFSAVATDPPYELGFMGKKWDSQGVSFQKETWETIRNACKSGASLLSFGGSRTQHRIACAIEDGGWEIRDTIMWVYGSGFPKSLNIGKAVDKIAPRLGLFDEFAKHFSQQIKKSGKSQKEIAILFPSKTGGLTGCVWNWANGANVPTVEQWSILQPLFDLSDEFLPLIERIEREREDLGEHPHPAGSKGNTFPLQQSCRLSKGTSEWEGYGTGLKPAYEPIVLAMKPLDGTFAENCLKWGVGGLNIDGCRISGESWVRETEHRRSIKGGHFHAANESPEEPIPPQYSHPQGRFPANFIHDGSQEVMELFPETKSGVMKQHIEGGQFNVWGKQYPRDVETIGDSGSAARFFYCAKASKKERDMGCEDLEPRQPDPSRKEGDPGGDNPRNRGVHKVLNSHPTVKPLALMEYLVRLVKMPEYNLILDPFMGSGTTLLACIKLGLPCIGIEIEEKYCEIAAKRCSQSVMRLNV